jgi:hypothetical protein
MIPSALPLSVYVLPLLLIEQPENFATPVVALVVALFELGLHVSVAPLLLLLAVKVRVTAMALRIGFPPLSSTSTQGCTDKAMPAFTWPTGCLENTTCAAGPVVKEKVLLVTVPIPAAEARS